MAKSTINFFLKGFLLFSPLLFLLLSFVIIDPFAILYKVNSVFVPSVDYKLTENYLSETKNTDYSAFVFGNSKTLAFKSKDWLSHINAKNVYAYGAPGESIENVLNKCHVIVKNDSMKYALLIVDEQIIENYQNKTPYLQGPVYKHHPLTSNESVLSFYSFFLRCYINDFAFIDAMDLYIKNQSQVQPEYSFSKLNPNFNSSTGEFSQKHLEDEISKDGFSGYYTHHKNDFTKSIDIGLVEKSKKKIHQEDVVNLEEIKKIFDKQNTEYYIIIGPTYGGGEFPAKYFEELQRIFSKENVFDYSDHVVFSSDSSGFYEHTHYRPWVGKKILDSIYSVSGKRQ